MMLVYDEPLACSLFNTARRLRRLFEVTFLLVSFESHSASPLDKTTVGAEDLSSAPTRTFLIRHFKVAVGWPIDDAAQSIITRAMTGTVPGLLFRVPVNDTPEMTTDGGAFVQLALFVAVN